MLVFSNEFEQSLEILFFSTEGVSTGPNLLIPWVSPTDKLPLFCIYNFCSVLVPSGPFAVLPLFIQLFIWCTFGVFIPRLEILFFSFRRWILRRHHNNPNHPDHHNPSIESPLCIEVNLQYHRIHDKIVILLVNDL